MYDSLFHCGFLIYGFLDLAKVCVMSGGTEIGLHGRAGTSTDCPRGERSAPSPQLSTAALPWTWDASSVATIVVETTEYV